MQLGMIGLGRMGASMVQRGLARGFDCIVAEVWRRGSVIGSWLLDLTAGALLQNPQLEGYDGRVSDSGEGRWTVLAAIDEAVPVPVLSAALYERFTSRGQAGFANRLLSAMRHEFGGHVEQGPGKAG